MKQECLKKETTVFLQISCFLKSVHVLEKLGTAIFPK